MKTAVHWFRRDLRITDNTALSAACAADQVAPVYVTSSWRGTHRWTGAPRQSFLCGSLASLDGNLRAVGGRLIVREGDAVDALVTLAREAGAGAVYANRDPDPFGRATEDRLASALAQEGMELRLFKDAAIHERAEVLTGSGGPFRVFTPYSKAWFAQPKPPVGERIQKIRVPVGLGSLDVPTPARWGLDAFAGGVEPGEKAARVRLKKFLSGPIFTYADRRDMLGEDGTSRLSQDLRYGLLSPREVYQAARAAAESGDANGRNSVWKFITELVWREFYFQILRHFPEVLETEFNPKYREVEWDHDEDKFAAWCEGRTGFPIVDAAMRQLNATGYMHNRARMISAMFLTKDLHLDWRMGEKYFMQRLLDGEIASNNGGWQWSAGTGADAAPYFRIQNPWTQTARFDPAGAYVKTWVPELARVNADEFFRPPSNGRPLANGYPFPILDHAAERDETLRRFKEIG